MRVDRSESQETYVQQPQATTSGKPPTRHDNVPPPHARGHGRGPKRLFTYSDVANMFGVKVDTVRHWFMKYGRFHGKTLRQIAEVWVTEYRMPGTAGTVFNLDVPDTLKDFLANAHYPGANFFHKHSPPRLEDLCKCTREDLLQVRYMGPSKLQKVIDALAKLGLHLREDTNGR